jgi:hypothetical protein
MFVESCKNGKKPYLRLVDSYTIRKDGVTLSRKKTVLNIGPLDRFDDGEPNYVKRLKDSYKAGSPLIDSLLPYVESEKSVLSCLVSKDTQDKLSIQPKLISDMLLTGLYEQLGIGDVMRQTKSRSKIDYDLNGITKLLTFGRILDPCSKLATYDQADRYHFPIVDNIKLSQVYDALDVLDRQSISIQKRLNTKISNSISRDNELTFYDVTNYFFEIEDNDEDGLRKRGYSKEHRPQPIVQNSLA